MIGVDWYSQLGIGHLLEASTLLSPGLCWNDKTVLRQRESQEAAYQDPYRSSQTHTQQKQVANLHPYHPKSNIAGGSKDLPHSQVGPEELSSAGPSVSCGQLSWRETFLPLLLDQASCQCDYPIAWEMLSCISDLLRAPRYQPKLVLVSHPCINNQHFVHCLNINTFV